MQFNDSIRERFRRLRSTSWSLSEHGVHPLRMAFPVSASWTFSMRTRRMGGGVIRGTVITGDALSSACWSTEYPICHSRRSQDGNFVDDPIDNNFGTMHDALGGL